MARRPAEPLPARAEVEAVIRDAVTRHAAEAGVAASAIRYEFRLDGPFLSDAVERVVIGYEMHRDDMARPCHDVVAVKDGGWRGRVDGSIATIAHHVARLEARRASFDPDRNGTRTPRRAWDIHPIAASVLSLYPRMPALDGTHRIDGAVGRVVKLGPRPGIAECVIAYGDGVIRLVEAEFEGGARLTQHDDQTLLRLPGEYPDIMKAAFKGAKPARIAALLGSDPRSGGTRVRKVATVDGRVELTFADGLVPWDRRARGNEPWRRRRLAA